MASNEDTKSEALQSSTNEGEINDVEGVEPKKLKYPKSIGFIISNEFCERFNYYGIRTVLVLYLSRKLLYDEDTATVIYHSFTTLVYFLCVVGAMIADSWLGKFKTILYLSIIYVVGSVILTLGAIPPLNLPGDVMTMIGLVLIALGSGGIKPCVAAFGGDQFKMPEQVKHMATYFSLFYFAINSGSLISTTVTPILREDVNCFESGDCFPLAFGVPGILMIISIVLFLGGKFLYILKKPSGNMLLLVSKCIGNAISTRSREKKKDPREHWLDYAEPVYGRKLVAETKILLRVLVLYIPLPVFWALFDQQGSRWTFQATRMDGDLGAFTIKPDQVQVINPLLILVFIPLYDFAIYPLIAKCGIRRPLQKLCIGGILAGIAFLISAVVELELEKTYPVLPKSGEAHFRFFNTLPCDVTFTAGNTDINMPDLKQFTIEKDGFFEKKDLHLDDKSIYSYSTTKCGTVPEQVQFSLTQNTATSYYFSKGDTLVGYTDSAQKSTSGNPLVRVLANTQNEVDITLIHDNADKSITNTTSFKEFLDIAASNYRLYIDSQALGELLLQQGGVYTLTIYEDGAKLAHSLHTISAPNTMSMLWIIPQYVVMSLGEVMYSVTGLEFSYSQAPDSMKAVLQACWLLTVAFGNLIVVIVAGSKGFDSQASEFFLFAGLMFVDMVLFAWLAYRYVPTAKFIEEDELVPVSAIEDAKPNSAVYDNPSFKDD